MAWVAVAIGGAALIGGAASVIGSSQQADAANNASDLQHQQYEETRSDYAPWRDAGKLALTQQTNLLGLNGSDPQTNAFTTFRSDPGYGFMRDEAIKGVDRSAAARGLTNSGAVIKAIQSRASDLADQSYGNYFARLQSLSGGGQTATSGTASAGANAAVNGGNAIMEAGQARASGYGGVASSINQGLNNYFSTPGVGYNSLSNLTARGIADNPNLF